MKNGLLMRLCSLLVIVASIASCKIKEKDIERFFGRLLKPAIEATFGVIDDPLLEDWLSDLGDRLRKVSKRSDIPYEFNVLDTKMVNAFAVPGGFIYITRGLLEFVDSEDELSAVIGHEIGHIEGKHSLRAMKRNLAVSVLLSTIKGSRYRDIKSAARLLWYFLDLKYSREQERWSDVRGVLHSFNIGYNPKGGITFFEKLRSKYERRRPSRLEVYFRTHPEVADRISRLRGLEVCKETLPNLLKVAQGYYERGFYASALAKYQAAIRLDPQNSAPLIGISKALLGLGEHKEAKRHIKILLNKEPENKLAKELLSEAEAMLAAEAAASISEIPSPASLLTDEQAADIKSSFKAIASQAKQLSQRLQNYSLQEQHRQAASRLSAIASLVINLNTTAITANKKITPEQMLPYQLSTQEEAIEAINNLNKAAYTLEAIAEDAEILLHRIHKLSNDFIVAIGDSSRLLRLSYPELKSCAKNLSEALAAYQETLEWSAAALQELIPAINSIAEAADMLRGAEGYVGEQQDGSKYSLPVFYRHLQDKLSESTSSAYAITSRTKKADQLSTSAKLYTELSELNLQVGATMSPKLEPMMVKIISRRLKSSEADIRELHQKTGWSYPEVALALSIAKSSKIDIKKLIRLHEIYPDWIKLSYYSKSNIDGIYLTFRLLCKELLNELLLIP